MPTVVSVQVPFFLQMVTLKSNSSPSENLVFADLQWLKCNTLSTRRGQLNRDFQLKDWHLHIGKHSPNNMMCFYYKRDIKVWFLASLLQLGRTPPSRLLTHPLTSSSPPHPPEPRPLPRCPVTTSSTRCPSAWTARLDPLIAWVMGLSPSLFSRWWESSQSPHLRLALPRLGRRHLPEDSQAWRWVPWWRWRRTPLCVVLFVGWVCLLASWSLWLDWSWWDNTAVEHWKLKIADNVYYWCEKYYIATENLKIIGALKWNVMHSLGILAPWCTVPLLQTYYCNSPAVVWKCKPHWQDLDDVVLTLSFRKKSVLVALTAHSKAPATSPAHPKRPCLWSSRAAGLTPAFHLFTTPPIP